MLLSPLKSPHGFICSSYLKELIPKKSSIHSFLPFSGETELSLISDNRDVLINTNNYVIYEFWSCYKTDPFRIADQAEQLHERTVPGMIKTYQNDWPSFRDPYLRSAIFFLLNRYSETGTLSYGNCSLNNYTPMCLNYLRRCDESVRKIKLTYHKSDDYLEGLANCSEDDVALIMAGGFNAGPLSRKTSMGHEDYNINQRHLQRQLAEFQKKFVLVYKNHTRISSFYKNYNMVRLNKFGKVTLKPELTEEIIVTNLEVPQ